MKKHAFDDSEDNDIFFWGVEDVDGLTPLVRDGRIYLDMFE
jgi:hypothetical protein